MVRSVVAVVVVLVVAAVPPAGAASHPGGTFVDDDGSIHEPAIEAIRAAEITLGCDPIGDRFCPSASVTRAEMAAFLVRALDLDLPSSPTPSFPDVAADRWYYAAVQSVSAAGIATGYADGTFRPSSPVSRAEMALFLVRALGVQASDPVGVFVDLPPGSFSAGAAERLFALGVTNGCALDPRRFCPHAAVTRAEMASFLARAFGLPTSPVTPRPSPNGLTLRLAPVVSDLTQPVFAAAPIGDRRLFVAEKGGRVRLVTDGSVTTFLDIRGLVSTDSERGLLGMAFDPGYDANGRLYVHYTDLDGANRVVEYRVSDDPDRADPSTARVLMTVPQPASNHNGGMIAFGPDGRLAVAIGDGGGAGDPYGNGQDPGTPLGAITLLDVDTGERSLFAYGLRNPWRFSWDGQRMYIGDVGQNAREEIDVVSIHDAGANLGWPLMEGTRCFVPGCSATGLVLPVSEYTHADGCSVTGGYVYRGTDLPELVGHYLYGDFCSGFVRSFRFTGVASEPRSWPSLRAAGLVSFGVDGRGELLVVSIGGSIWRIERG